MANNEFQEVDYLDLARSRATELFKDKVVFDKMLQLLTFEAQNIQKAYKDLMQLRSIDTATGMQLDIIGDIVGQDRILLSIDSYSFFGFVGAPKAGSFGALNNTSIGSKFWSLGGATGGVIGGNVQLDDDTYRRFIKAKIIKNNTRSTPEDFIKAINTIFGVTGTLVLEDSSTTPATVRVLFNKSLSEFEKFLLNAINTSDGYPSRLIPKTAGVTVKYGEYIRIDQPLSWSYTYDGISFEYNYPYTYNPIPTYSDRFDESDIEITLY